VGIHLAAEHSLELEPAHARFELAGVALDVTCGGLVVLTFGQFQQLCSIADCRVGAVQVLDLGGETRALPPELLGPIGRIPDGRIFEFPGYFFEAFFLAVVLKETPSRIRHVPRDL
jgi:hypothetical protein